jgi:Pvc16 N-terminal domain
MSSTLAIAAATLALKNRLQLAVDRDGLNAVVTGRPPDRARASATGNQLNVFLYDLSHSAAWRNEVTPRVLSSGEHVSLAPLGLSARYLLTAYAQDDEEELSHRLLGSAMLSLHDQSRLSTAELLAALPTSDLHAQVEHVRITPHPLGLDELSKLWTTFQAPYRATVAYELTVLLIDSRQPRRAALPVLQRGEADRGPEASTGPGPVLIGARPPEPLPAVRVGETLDWRLEHSGTLSASAHLKSGQGDLLPAAPLTRTTASAPFQLPVPPDAPWRIGAYQAWLTLPGTPPWETNAVSLTLAPTIEVSPLSAPAGPLSLTLSCRPPVQPGQSVLLLIHGLQLPPAASSPDGAQLTFTVPALAPDTYTVRLRVDGVDSLPVRRVDAGHPYQSTFDPAQQLVLT